MDDIPRRLLGLTREHLQGFRAVVVNGARQAGKTTLLEQVQADRGPLVTLDDAPALSAARSDPNGFLADLPPNAAIDEFQRGGDPLLLALKARIDRTRSRGQYLLAGSTRFLTTRRLSETLTGRVAIVELEPLSVGEARGQGWSFVDVAFGATASTDLLDARPPSLDRGELASLVATGGFPEVVLGPDTDRFRRTWVRNYVRTMTALTNVEQVAEVRRPDLFPALVQQLAARSAQEVVVSDLGRELQADDGTVRNYLDILATLYLVRVLPGWATSVTTRAKKRPVVHLVDTALACGLLGVGVEQLAVRDAPWVGPLLESFVVNELARQAGWSTIDTRMFHYRDRDQREIDIVLEHGRRVLGIEVKATATPTAAHARHLAALRDRIGDRFHLGVVLHTGSTRLPLGDRLVAIPVSTLWTV